MASGIEPHNDGIEHLHEISVVHEFPLNYFLENVAVRRTGQLLINVHNRNELIYLDPNEKGASPKVVHIFPGNVSGIVEVETDVFYVSSGILGQANTFEIFSVDFASVSKGGDDTPSIKSVVKIPEATFLNGSALLNRQEGIFLAVDSLRGVIYSVNTKTKEADVWLQHELLMPTLKNPNPGVNGIKFYGGYVYTSNTNTRQFLRISISGVGKPTGKIDVAEENLNIDDFAFDSDGSVYMATHIFQSVVKLRSNGARTRIAGDDNSALCAGTTSVAFGRTVHDRKSLYVLTTGGMSLPANGKLEPGRILRINVGHTEALNQHSPSVLFVTTSHDHLLNGAKTGVWLEEAAVPYAELRSRNVDVTVASPKGGIVPIDPRSAPTASQATAWSESIDALKRAASLDTVSAASFDGLFLPGGHGPMFDLAQSERLAALVNEFVAAGKPIGSVCHGPAGIANVELPNGNYLVAGKAVTAYSWEEELLAALDQDVPFSLEGALIKHGALYSAPHPRAIHVVADGTLVTGQNPASSKATATAYATVLERYRANLHNPSATSTKFQVRCHITQGKEADEMRIALRPMHYDFLSKNQNRIVFGGPVTEHNGAPNAMIIVIEADSIEMAKDFMSEEPYTKSGKVFSKIELLQWHQVLPDALAFEYAKMR